MNLNNANKTINFAVENVKLLDELSNSQFATAEIEAFSSGDNLHDLTCSPEILKETAHTIFEKPVIFEIDPAFLDFGTHNEGVTVPAGFVVPDSATFVKRDDGRTTLKVIAKIWKKYAKDFMKVFEFSDDKNKSVSVEVEIYDKTKPDEDGVSQMLSFAYAAITVLGDFFTPASPGANIQMLTFSKDDLRERAIEYKNAYRQEFSRYSGLDFSIPDEIKNNSKDALELRSGMEYGGTKIAISLAKYISENDSIPIEKLHQIAGYFSNPTNKPSRESDDGWITWQLYGGDASSEWSRNLLDEINTIDEETDASFNLDNSSEEAGYEKENGKMSKKTEDVVLEEEIQEFEESVAGEEADEDVMMEEDSEEAEDEAEDEEDSEEAEDEAEDEGDDEEYSESEESEDAEFESEDDDSQDADANFAMTAWNIDMQLQEALSEEKDEYGCSKYWVETHDDAYAYVYCYADGKTYRMKYTSTDNSVSLEISTEEQVVYEPMLIGQAEAVKTEFEALVKFKEDIEAKQFEFEVNSVLNDVKDVLPSDDIDVAREESKDFTLETLDGWKNAIKAKAFAVSKDASKDEDNDDGIVRMDTLFGKKNQEASLWQ